MRLLLDTSAYSAFMRAHEEVLASVRRADEMYLNPIVLGELLAGFRKGRFRRKNEEELQLFLSSSRVGLLCVGRDTAEAYAVILDALRSSGTPIPSNDIWIAASAMQHGLRVLTLNSHFLQVKQVIVDHYDP